MLLLKTWQQNLKLVETRIQNACARVKRSSQEITLVAVTKSLSAEEFQILSQDPFQHLGENRVPSLLERFQWLPSIQWHLIGHLQTNKISKLPPLNLIHSVDSEKLLQKLESHYQKLKVRQSVLLQINITQEKTKTGFSPQEAFQLLKQPLDLKAVNVLGLMTMAKQTENVEETRTTFRSLKNYLEEWKTETPSGVNLQYLSMGMSQDFEVALEEGATHLRLGSILFSST